MKEQSTDAYEIAYTGTFGGKTTVGLAVYLTDTDDNINFTYLFPSGHAGLPAADLLQPDEPGQGSHAADATTPAQPITLSPVLMGILRQDSAAVRRSDRAAGEGRDVPEPGPDPQPRDRGLDRPPLQQRVVGLRQLLLAGHARDPGRGLRARSPTRSRRWGSRPSTASTPASATAGTTFFGNANVNYASEALWVDVLNATYAGFTDAYTMLNATLGVKLADGKVTVSLKGINLTNEKIQQHIFGDILKRSVVAELRFFAK